MTKKLNRRDLLKTGVATAVVASMPTMSVAALTKPAVFIPPTTNTVHLAGRIGCMCKFTEAEVMSMFGFERSPHSESSRETESNEDDQGLYWFSNNYNLYYRDPIEIARQTAEAGDDEVYKRAQMLIDIRQKMNACFDFSRERQLAWLDQPNQHLEGETFRELMKRDLELATIEIDEALASSPRA